ncbi:hypothetical protein JVT61DRAFT_4496 [Boletus reticuloceps]|uniref:Uncharacterized protein n=1 Tax=Boletus reticuloceps TaxID=495285 RepID=A0A8I2YKT8_9AGAM|nr:hypothetical protein JVT61DRAFT_4496 [Boletus reticuloceps]
MIVKGIDDLMPLIPRGGVITADGFESNSAGPSRRLLQPRGVSVGFEPDSTAQSPGPQSQQRAVSISFETDSAGPLHQSQPAAASQSIPWPSTPPSTQRASTSAIHIAPVSPSSRAASVTPSRSTTPATRGNVTPANVVTPSRRAPRGPQASPMIYSHVRTIRGVMRSIYHYQPPAPSSPMCSDVLGSAAARYLEAHGYMPADIESMIDARQETTTEANFTLCLSGLGMAMKEAAYLYYLITHDD